MEELVPDADGQLDVERGGEEGEEPVEGDQADLNVVEGEHLVKGWQVGCHLTRNNYLRGERENYQGAEDHLISLGAPEVGGVIGGRKQILDKN